MSLFMLNENKSSLTGINAVKNMEVIWENMVSINESTAIKTWE